MTRELQSSTISLDGIWQFSLAEKGPWNELTVPGCWEAQGQSKFIEGPAYYRRGFAIPANWVGKQIVLEFDAVSYACTVWVNGIEVGQHKGLWTPFALNITQAARPGEDNLLEIEIWKPGKRFPMRSSLAGFLPDVATTFGGIWQSCRLRAMDCAFKNVSFKTNYAAKSLHVQAEAEFFIPVRKKMAWIIEIRQGEQLVSILRLPLSGKLLDREVSIDKALLWSPEKPVLYTVRLSIKDGLNEIASQTRKIGFRKLSTDGSQLLLNDSPFMVRGILSWGWVPERIAPTYTLEQARQEIRQVRSLGFNLIKLCLVIPSPEYFAAADEEGMLLWEELPMWLPEVTSDMRSQAPIEYAEFAALLADHPSIVLYSLGCELSQDVDASLIDQLNSAVRSRIYDVLLCDNSGSGESYGGLDFDFADFTDYHPYYDLQYFEPLLDNWRRDWQIPRPWIFGEFCDSDTFRDLNEIIQKNDGRRPWWITRDNPVTTWRSESKAVLEWEERLATAQPGLPIENIVQTSLQQSLLIRKYTLETLRRRRGMGGYIVTGLRDTPISTSGVWDDFGRPKWNAQDYLQINGEATLLLDVVRRRQWRFGGDRPDRVDPFNFWSGNRANWYVILSDTGSEAGDWHDHPQGSVLSWTLRDQEDNLFASGSQALTKPIQPGLPVQVGSINVSLPETTRPIGLSLHVDLHSTSRTVKNSWAVWVYPKPTALPGDITIFDPSGLLSDHASLPAEVNSWFTKAEKITGDFVPHKPGILVATAFAGWMPGYLQDGGRVLLLQLGEEPLPVRRCPFWRESVNLFFDHPFWNLFPQNGFSGMQFFGMATDLAFDTPRLLKALPPGATLKPIMRRLDAREFHVSEHIFEAVIGKGTLIGCTLRLQGGIGAQPFGWNRNVAGGAMLHSLLQYLVQQTSTGEYNP